MNRTIRVTQQTYNALEAQSISGRLDNSQTTFHPDGTLEFPVGEDVYEMLEHIRGRAESDEQVMRRLLDLKDH